MLRNSCCTKGTSTSTTPYMAGSKCGYFDEALVLPKAPKYIPNKKQNNPPKKVNSECFEPKKRIRSLLKMFGNDC
jgi:hypothetical protein